MQDVLQTNRYICVFSWNTMVKLTVTKYYNRCNTNMAHTVERMSLNTLRLGILFSWDFRLSQCILTLILLMRRIWWTPNNANRWQMGFNSAFKGLSSWLFGEGFPLKLQGSKYHFFDISNRIRLFFAETSHSWRTGSWDTPLREPQNSQFKT